MYQLGNNWGNGELDTGTNAIANGRLDGAGHMVVTELNNGGVYTSAHFATQGLKYVGPYGQVEASEQIGYTQGIGEAFWAMGSNFVTGGVPWPYCGEIDILESHGGSAFSEATSNGTIHGFDVNNGDNYGFQGLTMPYTTSGQVPLHNGFHTYGMYWEPYRVRFYVDGNVYSSPDVTQLDCNGTWPFNQPIFLINSAGLGGQVSGPPDGTTIFPMNITTDYVHYNTYSAGAPAAPGAVSATPSTNAVQLTWAASPTAGVGYNVYMNTTNTFTAGDLGTLVTWNVQGTSLYVSGLKPATQYWFYVVADNPGGESAQSTVSTTTLGAGHSGPVYIHCGGYGVDKYMKDLTYNVGGNPNYHWPGVPIVSGVANAAPSNVYNTERWGAMSYKVTDLNPNAFYTVRLHLIEDAGKTAGQRQFNSYLNGGQVLTNFDIYVAAGNVLGKAVVKDFSVLSDETGTINLDMAAGAADQPCISGLEIFANTGTNNLPAAPTNLTATATSTTNINLSWTASTTAGVTYNVYRANDAAFVSSNVTKVASGVTGTTLANAVPFPGMTYYYRVTAVNANGQSARSNLASATSLNQASNLVIAINANGPATGNFVADQWWGGPTYLANTTSTIATAGVANAAPAAVYQTERYGGNANPLQTFFYTFIGLTPGATYKIRLHNSENYWTATNQRVFNVGINGTTVLTNFDIVAAAGGPLKAVVNDFNAVADGAGHIQVVFTPGAHDLPSIKGLECYFVSGPAIGTPGNLVATGQTNQVSLTWNAVSGAASYNIYRSTTSGGEGTTAYKTGVTTNSNIDTAVTAGTTYFYKVAAVSGANTSAQSTEASATPTSGGTAPGAPGGVVASAANSQVTVSWTAGSGATSYNLYRSTTAGGEGTTPYKTNVTSPSADTGLTNGTTYFYKVASVNSFGTTYSAEVSGTPTSGGSGGVSIDCGGAANGTFVADTDFTGGATTSVTNAIDTSLLTGTIPAQAVLQSNRYGTMSYTIPGLTANASYPVTLYFSEGYWTATGKRTFNVVANGTTELTNFDIFAAAGAANKAVQRSFNINANASGQIVLNFNTVIDNAQVNAIVVGTSGGGTAPPAPTGLTATAGNAQVALGWTASSGATSYNVYRGTAAGGESATAVATGITTTAYTNTGLTNGTHYYFTVKAINANGTSGASNEANATPAAAIPPAPTGLTATAGNAQVALGWTASSGATSYNVYRGTAAGGESATAVATGVTGTSYTNTGLTNGTHYYFTVKAVNASGTSGASNEANATPAAGGSALSINCGGAAASPFVADVDFTNGGVVTWTNAVDTSLLTGTVPPQAVLQSDREGVFTYTIPGLVANSSHTVTMYFVEQYWSAAAKRVFNVASNGTTVLTNIDPFALAGAQFKAVQRSFTATANASGQIVLTFNASADQPKVGGIVVQ